MLMGRLNEDNPKTPLPITPLSGSRSRSGFGSGGLHDDPNQPYSITASEMNKGRRSHEDDIDSTRIDTERQRLHKLAQTKLRLVQQQNNYLLPTASSIEEKSTIKHGKDPKVSLESPFILEKDGSVIKLQQPNGDKLPGLLGQQSNFMKYHVFDEYETMKIQSRKSFRRRITDANVSAGVSRNAAEETDKSQEYWEEQVRALTKQNMEREPGLEIKANMVIGNGISFKDETIVEDGPAYEADIKPGSHRYTRSEYMMNFGQETNQEKIRNLAYQRHQLMSQGKTSNPILIQASQIDLSKIDSKIHGEEGQLSSGKLYLSNSSIDHLRSHREKTQRQIKTNRSKIQTQEKNAYDCLIVPKPKNLL